jgi:hypothetical protein
MRAGACEFQSNGAPDTARGAGDERNAAGKIVRMRGIGGI